MQTVYYDIRDFKWVKEDNTLYGDGRYLYTSEEPYYFEAFPNGKKQFVIKNYKTGNFRRFTFLKEVSDPFGNNLVFVSDDGYQCQVNIDQPKHI